jgi:hypothetical protein
MTDRTSEKHQKDSQNTKERLAPWMPLIFCVLLSYLAILGPIIGLFLGPTSSGWWEPVFFGMLPMCFFFVSALMSNMRREILELQRQIANLQQGKPASAVEAAKSPQFQFSLRAFLVVITVLAMNMAILAWLLGTIQQLRRIPVQTPAKVTAPAPKVPRLPDRARRPIAPK